ncbi:MAG: autotransporter outer membrane beta-barrel domain-containing protein [Chthoniobacterales bacterium]
MGLSAFAANPDPSSASTVGQAVHNPVTNTDTTVQELIVDPAGTPTAGSTAFVRTADGYAFLVKNVGEKIYNSDTPPLGFTVTAKNAGTKVATLDPDPVGGATADFTYQEPYVDFQAQFNSTPAPSAPGSSDVVSGASGVRNVQTGAGGSNGRAGALVVPPTSGGNGATGPAATVNNSTTISTTNQIGIEAGSIGGNGGKGGNSYLSVFSGRDGGNGGAGGPVDVTNQTGVQVATSGDDAIGIYAYSRSGQAGNGGSGFAAPGGGTGGHSADGGSVNVNNLGNIITTGTSAYGIYGLSVSNNGGNGGSQWGLVGESGSGGFGGSGGSVTITNGTTGTINTAGNFAHGIYAQSIGGSGGSSGTSGNLILSLQGASDNGGNGGVISVTNNGIIDTGGDDARGIFAQSIGGGGGAGGSSGGLIALGGSGSNGGSAGTVTVTNGATGSIHTKGTRSDAIFAQSVGGSGGSGSDAGGLVAVGGSGSKAGNGSDVTVENYGTITTEKDNARGIVAQSIGGGGGDGGSSGGMVSVGGSGDGGGTSGTVTVKNGGGITTAGNDARGILAQSVGGGGGNGGSSGSIGLFAGVAIGGSGGKGGAGGNVALTLQGIDANTASVIHTDGDRAGGLLGQSVGGGGGNGGGAVQVSVGFGGAASFAIGGQGGEGGQGGTVSLSNGGGQSIIETGGTDSTAAFLQSVGGGGGNGGYAVAVAVAGGPVSGSLSLAIGGKGAKGGVGGNINAGTFNGDGTLASTGFNGSILTTGERSAGFIAQSIGGGGGNGGLAVSGAGGGSLFFSGSIAVGLGGAGAGGGQGGDVLLGINGNIETQKASSTALLAQSVGGGGGNGGGSVAGSIAASAGGAASVSVGIGGNAGTGSKGGTVRLGTQSGSIKTSGQSSAGIVAQSVGGGGGNGGFNVSAGGSGAGGLAAAINVGLGGKGGGGGDGGLVTADLHSNVTTTGENSGAIVVQSVGGGGGNGGFNVSAGAAGAAGGAGAVSVGLGGSGGTGGIGGTVIAKSTGIISTTNDRSSGIVVQSIGGGGGNGGFNVSAGAAGAGVASGGVSVGLGGKAGAGNNAGDVTATTSGKVTTLGTDSAGIVAQSIGGGGGNGGFNVSGVGSGAGVGSAAISVGLGGNGGAGGDGKNVTLTVTNDVTTSGVRSGAVAAQSIGGGGGNGGFNISGAGSGAGVGSGSISVGLGGSGAGAGDGGLVNATATGDYITGADFSYGILAQSVGGGGGNGGFNISGGLSGGGVGSGGIAIGLGGSGGMAGNGGRSDTDRAVTLFSNGSVFTNGISSAGIIAQSIGGGGGNGGYNISATLSGAGGGSGAVSVGLGGSGGSGGSGKGVFAQMTSDVTTMKNDSGGILVQSVGGGGGNGGFNISGSLSGAGTGSGGISVGLGGNGGSGGRAGDIDSSSTGEIITMGDRSAGFVSQSIGGGGGSGGFNISGSLSGAGTGSGSISVGLGGDGGVGNVAGNVTALSTGKVWTFGLDSTGILAQSVGGGGGNGGYNISAGASAAGTGSGSVNVGLGGKGGAAANAGTVNLTVQNTVYTDKNRSYAVIGQSIGGGGGNGGFNISASATGAGAGSGAVSVGLGGNGAGGGNGGAVTVTTSDFIQTKGNQSGGILAQSVGGGGGNGGYNVSAAGSGAGTGSAAVSVGLGGSGAGGGDGSTVDLTVTNSVLTGGNTSPGIVAQSVGGGGGNGGFDVSASGSGAGTGSGAVSVSLGGSAGSGGNAERVTSNVTGDITTSGDNSGGLLAQSVGGGGGNGGFSVSAAISGAGTASGAVAVGLGGSGGSGGHSGNVTSTLTGDVSTGGKDASGIIAQSLGGGGGNGGIAVSGSISAAQTASGAVSVSIGGTGGGGGYAGTVNNTVTGNVTAKKENSGGILAQSLGGGGGNGGISVSGSLSLANTASGAVSVGVGGAGGGGGAAGEVTNNVTGTTMTEGDNGFGIAAQSIGGGGGNGGLNVSGALSLAKTASGAIAVGIGGAGGDGGDAANVSNTVSGYVQTLGDNATGILAQSAGGGGGNGGLNISGTITAAQTGSGGVAVGVGGFGGSGGIGKNVINNVTGGTVTTGSHSDGIVAQSLGGGGGNGAINVTSAVNLSKENGGALGIGIGGFGGDGGNSGDVTSTIATTVAHNIIATLGDNSSAIIAQSLAGGGGNGGVNVTGVVNLTGKNGAAIGVGVGGFGGGAGNAGNVVLGVTGPVSTQGNDSHGLLAQSIGGGGGNGGTNVTGALAMTSSSGGSSKAVAASIGIGGFGGDGGTAGNVDVTYTGTIVAQPRVLVPDFTDPITSVFTPAHLELKEGTGSHGIAAQSIGGGGGNGAINVSAGISYARGDGDGYGIVVGVGGFGGKGGNAGNVGVIVNGNESISSYGAAHSGILAQSVGGGGGNGGTNVSGGIVSDSPLIVGVGGFGADAGTAGNVNVAAATNVFASAGDSKNFSSAGILAQSLGGGGGNGGLNVSGGVSLNKAADVPSITVGVGGFGGAGSTSGNVVVNQTGNAITSGNWIHGVMAQSIAGGGGNGGLNVSGEINFADSENSGGKKDLTIVAGIGGNGGQGANAGNVSVTQNGIVSTKGDNARGVAAQSIGGGGGTGGMNVTGILAKKSSPVSVGVGGSGSGGGNAGSASVFRGLAGSPTGIVSTDGKGAYGIEATSIGGGGGDAGMNVIAAVSKAGDDDTAAGFEAQIAIGGAGGEAGNGGAARVENYSVITTAQDNSHGIISQSIGGGGGNANVNFATTYEDKNDKNMGFNLAIGGAPGDGGSGSTSDVIQVGDIETQGSNSYGILSQSIGGGGGNATLNSISSKNDGGKLTISLGRMGGMGGTGADVSLSSDGNVITHGDTSFGMLAQSVGNGGGNSSTTSITADAPKKDDDKPAESFALSVGLEGGTGGSAGAVILTAKGTVTTDGQGAHAIFAQSVGGGGGNGGSADTFGKTKAPTAALSLGGKGGSGGVSGNVSVTNSAIVHTKGESALGIIAQSIGGGGGTGGMARTGGEEALSDGATVSVGGNGGTGMKSGNVDVANSGIIVTDGLSSHGVLAQSIAGGGGNAGMTVNSILKDNKDTAKRLAVSVGGSGGDGAVSGTVNVVNTGGIGTNSANAVGIFAQSIGGGGGNSDSVMTGIANGMGGGNTYSMGIGGSGGTGGAARAVTVSNIGGIDPNSGRIETMGDRSYGVLAMSVGGGGGTGSVTETTQNVTNPTETSNSKSYSLSLGGFGGDGGTGGAVVVNNSGTITTHGIQAHGILAESIGGGGGNGGMSVAGEKAIGTKSSDTSPTAEKAVALSIGGSGGTGNKGGDVTVNNTGGIEVFGEKAYGIYAQSVGGGGGDGGMSIVTSRDLRKNPQADMKGSSSQLSLGGAGGDGADSGNVLIQHDGNIISHGDNSYGIFAQSVSGGGGNVGLTEKNPAWMAGDFDISTLIGGQSGSNGIAGTVTINTKGSITMLGKNSFAQLGQSINGGGGNVDLFLDFSEHAVALGDNGVAVPPGPGTAEDSKVLLQSKVKLGSESQLNNAGSAILSTHVGDLVTQGKSSVGSLIQSIGGGGGNHTSDLKVDTNAIVNLALSLGGKDSTNNSGGAVSLDRAGNILTTGSRSPGSVVQSIGGGGGNLAASVTRVPAPALPKITKSRSLTPRILPPVPPGITTANGTLGADNGTLSNGGDMNVSNAGDVQTMGKNSYALLVQSVGGGGGKLDLTGFDAAKIALGGTNGSSGNGGAIVLNNTGDIMTSGPRANGIIAQSIGGGGGAVFTDTTANRIKLQLRSDNTGNGGDVLLNQLGNVQVDGTDSVGIFLQSIGGGGGSVDRIFSDTAGGAGNSGAVTLLLKGDVAAGGFHGTGIFAQSRSMGGQGNILISSAWDHFIYAGAKGVAVQISGGSHNEFINRGLVSEFDGVKGWSVIGGYRREMVDNYGTMIGQVDLGKSINGFTNHSNATLIPGPLFLLGAPTNLLLNEGVMITGGVNNAQHTDVTGSFVQTDRGVTFGELDFARSELDQYYLTGTAKLAGEMNISLLNPQLVPAGHFQKVLYHAVRGVTDDGMFLTTAPSVVINYDILYPDKETAVLDFNVDFSLGGALGRNLRSVGDYINRIQNAGSSKALADTIVKLLYDPTIQAYKESLSQLAPDIYGEHQADLIRGSERFNQLTLEGGNYRFDAHGRLLWFNLENQDTLHRSYVDYKAVRQTAERAAVGIEQEFNDHWTAGLAFSVEKNEASGYNGLWTSDGTTEHLGAVLKKQIGATEFAGVVSYSWNQTDTERQGRVTTHFTTDVTRDIEAFNAMLRASHVFDLRSFYLKPIIDVGYTYLMTNAATEKNGGATSLTLRNYDESHYWTRPALEFGNVFTFADRSTLRVYGVIDYQYYFQGRDTFVRAGFAGAPSGVSPINDPIELDSFFDATIGLEYITRKNIGFGVGYSKTFGDHYDRDLINVKFSVPF